MLYAISYILLACLAFSGEHWEAAFWVAFIMSVHFGFLYLTYRNLQDENEGGVDPYTQIGSPLAELVPVNEEPFEVPTSFIPGTYDTKRDYGFKDDLHFINFSLIHPFNEKYIEAALSHISRMMAVGRPCYVVGLYDKRLMLVTRAGSKPLSITYIDGAEAVTKLASDVGCVIISP